MTARKKTHVRLTWITGIAVERTFLLRGRDLCSSEDLLLEVEDSGITEVHLDGSDTLWVAEAYWCHDRSRG